MKISLFTKLSAAYLIVFTLFSGVGFYSTYVYHLTTAQFRAVNRFHLKLTIYAYDLESRQSALLQVIRSGLSEGRSSLLLSRWLNIMVARREAGIRRIEKLCRNVPEEWQDDYFEVRIIPVVRDIRLAVDAIEYEKGRRLRDSDLRDLEDKEKKVMRLVHKLALASRNRLRRVASRLEDKEERQLRIHLALLIMALAGGIAGAWIARRSLVPLQTLTEGARRFRQGELDTRIPVESRDELGELAMEFNDMAQAIKEREERLIKSERLATAGKLAAGIAHEIRNPLAAISFQVQLLQELLETGDEEDLRQAKDTLVRLQSEIDRLEETSTQYLDFARQPLPKIENVELIEIIEEMTLATQGMGIELQAEIPESCTVIADRDMFHRIMLNIIKNSAEAGASVGKIRVEKESDAVILTYSDNGPGMSEEVAERIFEPFFSTKKQGTGLGLALVRRMMMDMGGNVTLESARPPEFRFVFRTG